MQKLLKGLLAGALASGALLGVSGVATASNANVARVLGLSLKHPVLPAAGGRTTLRLEVRGALTCRFTAPSTVQINRATRGCRNGLVLAPVSMAPRDSIQNARATIVALVTDAGGHVVRRTTVLRERGLAPVAVSGSTIGPLAVNAPFAVDLSASGGRPPYHWRAASGTLPPGMSLSVSGVLRGTPVAAGTYTFTAEVTGSTAPNPLRQHFTLTVRVVPPPLLLPAPQVPAAYVGAGYRLSLGATGGTPPYTWRLVSGALPPGLTLAPDGVVSGTPAATGVFTAVVQASDASSPARTARESLTVGVVLSPLAVTTPTGLPAAAVGVDYSVQLIATGGATPYTWALTAGSLPAGLTLSPAGLVGGTPASVGVASFTVSVADASSPRQVATATLTLTVARPALAVTTTSLQGAPAVAGAFYQIALQASGGTTPYSWSLVSGSLPPGVGLSSSGLLSGVPAASGQYRFVVEVTDASSPRQVAQQELVLTVLP